MRNHAVLEQGVQTVREIFPKKKFGKGKLAQPDLRLHFPALHVAHSFFDNLQYGLGIHSRVILRQGFQTRNFQFEVLPQHFQEGGIDPRFLIDLFEDEPLRKGLPFQLHRHEQEGRTQDALALLRLAPLQYAHRRIQGVHTIFLQRSPRGPIQIQQTLRVLRLLQCRVQDFFLELILQISRHGIRLFDFEKCPGGAGVLLSHHSRNRQEL